MSRPLPQPTSRTTPPRAVTGSSDANTPGAARVPGVEPEPEVVHEGEIGPVVGRRRRGHTVIVPARG